MKCPTCNKRLSYQYAHYDAQYNQKCSGHIYALLLNEKIIRYKFTCSDNNYIIECDGTHTKLYHLETRAYESYESYWEILSLPKPFPLAIKDEIPLIHLVEDKIRKYLIFS